jgi:hypothetical protein
VARAGSVVIAFGAAVGLSRHFGLGGIAAGATLAAFVAFGSLLLALAHNRK